MKNYLYCIASVMLCSVALFAAAGSALAQKPGEFTVVPSKAKPVLFHVPDGYSRMPFADGRSGLRMKDPKRTGVIYLVYPTPGELPDRLTAALKQLAIDLMNSDPVAGPVQWTSEPLPAHENVANESGLLYSATRGDREIQLAQYTRTMGLTKIIYGYYAVRFVPRRPNGAPFLNNLGAGVPELDKFAKSLREQK
jgi:hypothetical protein